MKPLLLVTLALALAACGAAEEVAAPPTLPASALPELDSRARTLGAPALAADAFEPAALERLLESSDYVTGSEREFSGKTKIFDHVVARSLRFDSAEGAEAYLGWLRKHGDEILGRIVPVSPPVRGESAVAFALVRCSNCKKQLPTFLAGWRRDDAVLSLLAAGSGATPERFAALARDLDEVAQ